MDVQFSLCVEVMSCRKINSGGDNPYHPQSDLSCAQLWDKTVVFGMCEWLRMCERDQSITSLDPIPCSSRATSHKKSCMCDFGRNDRTRGGPRSDG